MKDHTEFEKYEDACKFFNLDPNVVPGTEGLKENLKAPLVAVYQLMVVSEAIRQGWVPNYDNYNQDKYENIVDLDVTDEDPAGFRFWVSNYTYTDTRSVLGPLLAQETPEKSKYLFTQFSDLHKVIMKPQQ